MRSRQLLERCNRQRHLPIEHPLDSAASAGPAAEDESSELQEEQRRRWRESSRKYSQKYPQKIRQRKADGYQRNKEQLKEKKRKYNAEYYNKHKAKLNEKVNAKRRAARTAQRVAAALALDEAPPAMPLPLENPQVRRYHELQRAAGREPSQPRALPGFRERLVRRIVTIEKKFNDMTQELDHMTTREVRIYEYI